MLITEYEGFYYALYSKDDLELDFIEHFAYGRACLAVAPLMSHAHDDCIELTFILNGNQNFYVGGDVYKLSGNEIFVTYPGEYHSTGEFPIYRNECYCVAININRVKKSKQLPDSLKSMLVKFTENRNYVYKFNKLMLLLLKNAYKSLTSSDPIKKVAGIGYIISLLSETAAQVGSSERELPPEIFRAIKYIESNISEVITLEELSRVSGLSLSHFKVKFKNETGVTPWIFIMEKKIELSKEMLKKGGMSITKVAYELNFGSASYFSFLFKRFCGMTPTEYKKNTE